jgi:hypothetical protein
MGPFILVRVKDRNLGWLHLTHIRVICKVRQTQHQNPEFSHTQGEIKKTKTSKKSILAFKREREGGGG